MPTQETAQSTRVRHRKRRHIDRQRPDVTYSRKRAIAACRICRVKKVKCNNVRPVCGSCMASHSTCVYEGAEEDHSSFDPASIAILDRLNQVLESVEELPGIIKTMNDIASQSKPPTPRGDSFSYGQELSSDDLTTPPAIMSVESVLGWPILAGCIPPNHILEALSDAKTDLEYGASLSSEVDEKEMPRLVRHFLAHVHPVNPILDVDTVYSHSLRISETGIGWDGASCIVLIACALGCLGKPYDTTVTTPLDTSTARSSLESQGEDLVRAKAYFNLARQRLGLVDQGLIAAQCHFFAGVYYMFTLAPLRAWSQFEHAANIFHVYWRYQSRGDSRQLHSRRLAQSCYWSCLKSQVELGLDLHLPQSVLKNLYDAGSELPMPPELPCPDTSTPPQTSAIFPAPGDSYSSSAGDLGRVQEESWYFYLTEITLRRFNNRAFNLLYRDGRGWGTTSSLSIASLISAVSHIEDQLDNWAKTMPLMAQISMGAPPTNKLALLLYARILELKCLMYRPFLYHATHTTTSERDQAEISHFVEKGLSCHFLTVTCGYLHYRNHVTYQHLRASTAAAVCIMAIVKSGRVRAVHQRDWHDDIKRLTERIRYWQNETATAERCADVLEAVMLSIDQPQKI
ncbi:unnamed protein product [Fusarium graminearum]|nr:unnamed protein product [Fusarium graminearum]